MTNHSTRSAVHNGEPTAQTHIDGEPHFSRRARALSLVGTTAVATIILGVLFHGDTEQSESGSPDRLPEPNPNVISLTINEGAQIFHEPHDDGDVNNLITTTDSVISIEPIHHVYEVFTSGEWNGFTLSPHDELPDGVVDSDNIGWVRAEDSSVEE
jgi:hypothetical protein